jgi:hypothetical protein
VLVELEDELWNGDGMVEKEECKSRKINEFLSSLMDWRRKEEPIDTRTARTNSSFGLHSEWEEKV